MTASVITRLEPDFDSMLVGLTPFKLELKGVPETRVKVEKIQDQNNGAYKVRITSPVIDGKPLVPFPTLDQVARRLIDGARVAVYGKNGGALIREYTA
jgi:hypothetical protein